MSSAISQKNYSEENQMLNNYYFRMLKILNIYTLLVKNILV